MEISVPLKRFNEYVFDAAKLDLEYPQLRQKKWLLNSFSYDDETAHYEPHQPWPKVDRAAWWWRICKN